MTTDLLIANGGTWALQVLMLVALTALMLVLLRVTDPLIRLRTWHGVVALALALPAIVPWRTMEIDSGLPAASSGGGGAVSWSFWILSVIVAGLALRGFWLAGAMAKLGALRRSATWWRPDWIDRLSEEVGARADVGTSAQIRSAVTFGFRKPAILVPDALAVASEGHQRAVVAHELHHVARRDWLWVLGEEAVRTTFWWHPAVWFALAEARQAREELVDRQVIGVTGNRETYVEALVAAARPQHSSVGAFVPHFFRRHQLKARIHRLLKENDMSPQKTFACAAVLALALPATAWAAGAAFPFVSENSGVVSIQDPPPPPPPAPVRAQRVQRERVMPPPPPPAPPPTRQVRRDPPAPPAPPAQDAPRLKRRAVEMPPAPARVKRLRVDVAPAPDAPRLKRQIGDAPPPPPPPPGPDAPRVKRRSGDAPPLPPPPPPRIKRRPAEEPPVPPSTPSMRRVVKRSPPAVLPSPPPPPPKKIIKG